MREAVREAMCEAGYETVRKGVASVREDCSCISLTPCFSGVFFASVPAANSIRVLRLGKATDKPLTTARPLMRNSCHIVCVAHTTWM